MLQGVSVSVYEASGLSVEDEQGWRQVQEHILIHSGSITFILYCFKMSETRQSLTDTFKVFYSDDGVHWSKTVVAMTFADSISVPKAICGDPNFNMKQHFVMHISKGMERPSSLHSHVRGWRTNANSWTCSYAPHDR